MGADRVGSVLGPQDHIVTYDRVPGFDRRAGRRGAAGDVGRDGRGRGWRSATLARTLAGGDGPCVPDAKPPADHGSTLLKTLQLHGIAAVVHGFRLSARLSLENAADGCGSAVSQSLLRAD